MTERRRSHVEVDLFRAERVAEKCRAVRAKMDERSVRQREAQRPLTDHFAQCMAEARVQHQLAERKVASLRMELAAHDAEEERRLTHILPIYGNREEEQT